MHKEEEVNNDKPLTNATKLTINTHQYQSILSRVLKSTRQRESISGETTFYLHLIITQIVSKSCSSFDASS